MWIWNRKVKGRDGEERGEWVEGGETGERYMYTKKGNGCWWFVMIRNKQGDKEMKCIEVLEIEHKDEGGENLKKERGWICLSENASKCKWCVLRK